MVNFDDMREIAALKVLKELQKKNPAAFDAGLLKMGWLCYKQGFEDAQDLCSCKQVVNIAIPPEVE